MTAAVVQVAGSRGLMKRGIRHVIPIEVRLHMDSFTAPQDPENSVTTVSRPRQKAAEHGERYKD